MGVADEPAVLRVGGRLGPYALDTELGSGATGVVYRARRDGDDQVVALKVLRWELSTDPAYAARFEHEVRAASAVQHRHLVPIVDAGAADGWRYIAAAYVPGTSLQERLAATPGLTVAETVRVARHVAGALDALHQVGLVHRDVKPANVLLDEDGNAALTDFGLAKGPAYTVLTQPGQLMGTADYLAPELVRGGTATPASDLYALGCLTYACLAGAPPFAGRSVFRIAQAHLEETPPDLAGVRSDLPPALAATVLLALEKDPTRRPHSATAYATLLRVAGGP